jgi:hypothetical protein
MSKKHMGSSIDDFLKEEGIFEETQGTRGQGGRRVAAREGHEEKENFEEEDGHAAQDERS